MNVALEPALPTLTVGVGTELLVCFSGLVLKPTYMTLTLVLLAWVGRTRGPGMGLLKAALGSFFFGEAMCAADYLSAAGASNTLELLHGAGMVGMGAFLPWAIAEISDDRVVRFDAPVAACSVQRLCGKCWKREPVACGLHRLFEIAALGLAAVAAVPLTAKLGDPHIVDVIVFRGHVIYGVPTLVQWVEFRLYPGLAVALFLGSFVALLVGRRGLGPSKPLFFAGIGFMSFSLFRFVLYGSFAVAPWWGDFWEEATEMLAIAGIGAALWAFRRPLGLGLRKLPIVAGRS